MNYHFDYNTVSFPELGIAEFKINPTAFKLPFGNNITIEWYAIFICVGILLAYFVCDRLAKRFNVVSDDILDILLFSLPAGFVGARVWYILGDLGSFHSFMDMIAVWNGGLAIYGGIFGGCLAAFFVCRFKKISFLNMLDLASIGFMIGQIIGRWGNFFNVEVFGVKTDLPWMMGVGVDGTIAEYVHPLFLYESLWNLVGLFIVFAYMDSRKFRGQMFLIYTAWYGIGRAWMEPLRDAEYNLKIFGLRVNMLLAIVLAVVSIALIVLILVRKPARLMIVHREEEVPESEYEPQFDYAMDAADEPVSEANEETAEETDETEEEKNGEDY